jgi:hypothetical protein
MKPYVRVIVFQHQKCNPCDRRKSIRSSSFNIQPNISKLSLENENTEVAGLSRTDLFCRLPQCYLLSKPLPELGWLMVLLRNNAMQRRMQLAPVHEQVCPLVDPDKVQMSIELTWLFNLYFEVGMVSVPGLCVPSWLRLTRRR